MSDLIDRQELLKALDKLIPSDPMKDDYTKGITVGVARATGFVEKFSQENGGFSQGLVKDLISRKDAIEAIMSEPPDAHYPSWYADVLWKLPSACNETKQQATKVSDCISRQKVIDALSQYPFEKVVNCISIIEELPSVEPEKENPRRVLWSGWKGTRYTRYKCPNCNKPVKNDDVHCHRCGQKLMFPHISHTPYIEGQKQELIVRWDDEE